MKPDLSSSNFAMNSSNGTVRVKEARLMESAGGMNIKPLSLLLTCFCIYSYSINSFSFLC